MMKQKITVQSTIHADKEKVWDCYTNPKHIVGWNFADPSWHCPSASNDMHIGGVYNARMEAKDGSFGFDFKAIYSEINHGQNFTYGFEDRTVFVEFTAIGDHTEVSIVFDPEDQNPLELQQQGWQPILNNFKAYTENN